jgi:hypothetical protein
MLMMGIATLVSLDRKGNRTHALCVGGCSRVLFLLVAAGLVTNSL